MEMPRWCDVVNQFSNFDKDLLPSVAKSAVANVVNAWQCWFALNEPSRWSADGVARDLCPLATRARR